MAAGLTAAIPRAAARIAPDGKAARGDRSRALLAILSLAVRATGTRAAFLFQRLEDGSYVLECATEAVPALHRWHAALPLLERDLGGGAIGKRLRPLVEASGPVAFLGGVRSRQGGWRGAVALLGAAAVTRRQGKELTDVLAPLMAAPGEGAYERDLAGRLRLRVYRLHTIFDLSRTLSATFHAGRVLRALATTLIGQLMVGHAAVLRPRRGARARVHLFPFDGSSRAACRRIEGIPFSEIAAAARKGRVNARTPVGAALAAAGLARLFPMESGGEVIGVVGVARKTTRLPFTEEDDEFAKTLVNHAALALANARLLRETVEKQRLERELAFARTLQNAILPEGPVRDAAISIAGQTIPCFEIGGDYFDIVPLPGRRLLVAVGDVAGKGVPAALLMASVAATVRTLARLVPPLRPGSLGKLVGHINEVVLHATAKSRFVSLLLLTIDPDTGSVRYVNAGHNPGVLLGRVRARLDIGGMPVGLFAKAPYAEGALTLPPGAALLLYTDGVAEAGGKLDLEKMLPSWAEEALPAAAPELVRGVLSRVRGSVSGAPADDMTLLAVTRDATPVGTRRQ